MMMRTGLSCWRQGQASYMLMMMTGLSCQRRGDLAATTGMDFWASNGSKELLWRWRERVYSTDDDDKYDNELLTPVTVMGP